MAQQYEFFVASFPEFLTEDGRALRPLSAFMDDIPLIAEEPDTSVVAAMRMPIDNRNLINILESRDEFDDRGNYTREDLTEAVKTMGYIPEYMQTYLLAQKENRLPFPGLSPLDQLTWLFYDEMAESENEFLRVWYDFDLALRNIVAAINIRKGLTHIEAIGTERDRPAALTIIGRGTAAEAALKSTAPDFGLGGEYPWVERVVALTRGGLTEMEKGLDDLRWEMLTEFTAFSHFDIEMVAGFVQKLLIAERWMKLDPAHGRTKLDKLVEEMMGSFVMPAGFD